jgi:hypothetical protein
MPTTIFPEKSRLLDVALIAILLLVFCLRIWDFGIVYRDDTDWAVMAFRPETYPPGIWARSQGRLYAFPYGTLMLHALSYMGTTYGEILNVGSFAAFFTAFHAFVAVYFGWRVAMLSACFFFAFFAMRWEQSWLTGGPLAPWVISSAFVASALFARAYAARGGVVLAVAAGLCLFASLFIHEGIALLFFLLSLVAAVWNGLIFMEGPPGLRGVWSVIVERGRTRVMLIVFVAVGVLYWVLARQWAFAHPSQYDGHILAPFDLRRVAITTVQFMTSNSIVRDFFQPYLVNFSDTFGAPRSAIVYKPSAFLWTLASHPAALFTGAVVAVQFWRTTTARGLGPRLGLPVLAPELLALLCGLMIAILPILPVAMTIKYQAYYFEHGVTSYNASIVAYFGLTLALAAVVSAMLKLLGPRWRQGVAIVLGLGVGIVGATSSRMNDVIAADMRPEAARWRVVELALRSVESSRMNVSAIWAPGLQRGSWFASLPLSYWTEYVKARYKSAIRFPETLPVESSGAAVLDFVLDDDGGVIATIAELQSTGHPEVRGRVASRIIVALERPNTFKLASYRLLYTDVAGNHQRIALDKLAPSGPRHSVWAVDNIRAVPETIRVSKWSAVR